jgi:hypothetical protein
MAQYAFAAGYLFGLRNDVANATPVRFGALQEVQIDIQYTLKELYGQNAFPLAIARGQGKIQGKAKFAQINGLAFNNLFFGQAQSAGQQATSVLEAATVPAVTPFTVTVANAASFVADLGVAYAATGVPLAKVTGAPSAAGQYSVNAATGVYTFFSGDAAAAVLVTYTFNVTTSGQKIAIANAVAGVTPTFQVNLAQPWNGKTLNLQLNSCVSGKLGLATKAEDFLVPELDFSAQADAAGNIGALSLGE